MEVKEAVTKAYETFSEIFPKETQSDFRLEEVKLSDDEVIWSTTFSFRNPEKLESSEAEPGTNLASLFGNKQKLRAYKTVKLRDADGKFLGVVNGS